MRIVVTSDWHLDANTGGFPRIEDIVISADEVVSYAIESKADLFIFLGDLCDPDANRAPRCVAYAIGVARRLHGHGIASRWLVGNHDVIEDGSGSNTLAPLAATVRGSVKMAVVDRPCAEVIDDHLFVWLPYVPRCAAYDPEAFLAGIEGTPVLVAGHLTIPGMHPGSETTEMGRGRDVLLPVDTIRQRWPHALLLNGHYHQSRIDTARVSIPGSLARLTFGEEVNTPSFLAIDTRHRRVISIPVSSRRVITLGSRDSTLNCEGGAIVRVSPEIGDTPEAIATLVAAIRTTNPAAIKVLPAAHSSRVVASDRPAPTRMRARAVVDSMIVGAVGVDRVALATLAGSVMDQEGL